jgi:hypothetical protein
MVKIVKPERYANNIGHKKTGLKESTPLYLKTLNEFTLVTH